MPHVGFPPAAVAKGGDLCYLPRGFPGTRWFRRRFRAAIHRPTTCRDTGFDGALIEDRFPLASESTGVSGLAERYAAALFELADERGALDAAAGDLRAMRAMLHDSADLSRLLRSPVLSREAQGKAIQLVAEKAELSQLTRDFLAIVARNRRLFAVPAMIDAYLAKLAERRGEVTAEVTAAQPLTEAQNSALGDQLRRAVGSQVAVDMKIDPGLIGGMIVKIGSRMVDGSIRSKLQRMRLALRAGG
jgi:F-type H+-transporting ATPase subunit delta